MCCSGKPSPLPYTYHLPAGVTGPPLLPLFLRRVLDLTAFQRNHLFAFFTSCRIRRWSRDWMSPLPHHHHHHHHQHLSSALRPEVLAPCRVSAERSGMPEPVGCLGFASCGLRSISSVCNAWPAMLPCRRSLLPWYIWQDDPGSSLMASCFAVTVVHLIDYQAG